MYIRHSLAEYPGAKYFENNFNNGKRSIKPFEYKSLYFLMLLDWFVGISVKKHYLSRLNFKFPFEQVPKR